MYISALYCFNILILILQTKVVQNIHVKMMHIIGSASAILYNCDQKPSIFYETVLL